MAAALRSKSKNQHDTVDLHDALLRTISVDYGKARCVIEIDYYLKQNDRKRVSGRIVFDSTETIAFLGDIAELKRHEFASHISYWRQDPDSHETYIYLAAGSIMVRAGRVALVRERKALRSKEPRNKNA